MLMKRHVNVLVVVNSFCVRNKEFMKSMVFSIVVFLSFGCQPVSEVSQDDRLKLYNDALDQIITDNYFQHCLDPDEGLKIMWDGFIHGKIDSLRYLAGKDSLVSVRKRTLPKCVLDYSNEFQILTQAHVLDENIKSSIAESLNDPFVNDFVNGSVETIIDTLSQTVQLNVRDLVIGYLEVVPYTRKPFKPYGEGIGVISFSRIYFDEKGSKAILFYEFNCGPKCGSGEIVFLERENGKWKIVEYKRIWDS